MRFTSEGRRFSSRLAALGTMALVAAVWACCAGRVDAVPISTLYNTGVDDNLFLLSPGAVDPHYTMIFSDDAAQFPLPDAKVVYAPVPGGWTPNTATSQWIASNPDQATGNSFGVFIYLLTFDLVNGNTPLDPDQVSISGEIAVDEICLIKLNSIDDPIVTITSGTGQFHSFTIPAGSGFVPGTNTLQFSIINTSPGSTGMQIMGLSGGTVDAPEPGSLVLLGLGVVGLMGWACVRRRGG